MVSRAQPNAINAPPIMPHPHYSDVAELLSNFT